MFCLNFFQVINDDVRKQAEVVGAADVIVLHNVFSFFLPLADQVNSLLILKQFFLFKSYVNMFSYRDVVSCLKFSFSYLIIIYVTNFFSKIKIQLVLCSHLSSLCPYFQRLLDLQTECWEFLRKSIRPGAIIISNPAIEAVTDHLVLSFRISEWLEKVSSISFREYGVCLFISLTLVLFKIKYILLFLFLYFNIFIPLRAKITRKITRL